jgi:hypothetical protein
MRVQMTVGGPWKPILKRLLKGLSDRGFTIRRTFDLQRAGRSPGTSEEGMCPHHGSERCSCQYIVLHVCGAGANTSVLVLHGRVGTTKVSLISAAGEKADAALAIAMCEAVQIWQRRPRAGNAAGRASCTGAADQRRAPVTLRKGERI